MAACLGLPRIPPHRHRGRSCRRRLADGEGASVWRRDSPGDVHARPSGPRRCLSRGRWHPYSRHSRIRRPRHQRRNRRPGDGDRCCGPGARCGLHRGVPPTPSKRRPRRLGHPVLRRASRDGAAERGAFSHTLRRTRDPCGRSNPHRSLGAVGVRKPAHPHRGPKRRRYPQRPGPVPPAGRRNDPSQFLVAIDRRTGRWHRLLAGDAACVARCPARLRRDPDGQ